MSVWRLLLLQFRTRKALKAHQSSGKLRPHSLKLSPLLPLGWLCVSGGSMYNNFSQHGKNFRFEIILLLLLLGVLCRAPYATGQAIAETATTTALSAGTTAAAAKTIRFPSVEITGGSGAS